jgi:hypothetical protein
MPGELWTTYQIDFLQNNFQDMSCKEIGKVIGKTTKSVQHKFGKLGLKRNIGNIGDKVGKLTIYDIKLEKFGNQNKSFAYCNCDCGNRYKTLLTLIGQKKRISCGCVWKTNLIISCQQRSLIGKDKHKEIIDKFKSGRNCSDIAKDYNVEYYIITKILLDNGIIIDQSLIKRKFSVNDNYFDKIDTEDKAYWLGFLYGDGCIGKTRVGLGLKESDLSHIEKFANALDYNGTITLVEKIMRNKSFYSHRVSISSRRLAQKLREFGCYSRKTFILRPPKLNINLERHFWRGLVDADGSLYYGNKSLGIHLLGTKYILDGFIQFLYRNDYKHNINTRRISHLKHDRILQVSVLGNNRARWIVNLLYNNSKIYLDRKYDKIKHLLNN